MRVLLIGSGAREHALAWKLNQSPQCEAIFIAAGNAGTAAIGTNVPLDISSLNKVKNFVLEKSIHLLVIGPEAPLVKGLMDALKAEPTLRHLKILGPSKAGAQLEGSKIFAKKFMTKYSIPTASFQSFRQSEVEEAIQHISQLKPPVVLKADGLAAGKGVLICKTIEEAKKECQLMLNGKFGLAGQNLVIESFLEGLEFSVFILTDGNDYTLLPVAKDYKRAGENDTGLNTGGMGAVSPVPGIDAKMIQKVRDEIIEPTLEGLRKEKIPYNGFLFFGLMAVDDQPYVIEYNCRLGDPETQVVMPRIQSDLLPLIEACADGQLNGQRLEIIPDFAICTVLASGGYPLKYQKGKVIRGLESLPDEHQLVFHAGTAEKDSQIITNGGRVLSAVGISPKAEDALQHSQKAAASIQFDEKYFRSDIGRDLGIG